MVKAGGTGLGFATDLVWSDGLIGQLESFQVVDVLVRVWFGLGCGFGFGLAFMFRFPVSIQFSLRAFGSDCSLRSNTSNCCAFMICFVPARY